MFICRYFDRKSALSSACFGAACKDTSYSSLRAVENDRPDSTCYCLLLKAADMEGD